jgi:hypothetical protein
MGESMTGFDSGLRIGDESNITVSNELLVEPEDILVKGGERVGLEYREVNGDEYSVPGTVGSLARLLLRTISPSFSLQYLKNSIVICDIKNPVETIQISIAYLVNVKLLIVVPLLLLSLLSLKL